MAKRVRRKSQKKMRVKDEGKKKIFPVYFYLYDFIFLFFPFSISFSSSFFRNSHLLLEDVNGFEFFIYSRIIVTIRRKDVNLCTIYSRKNPNHVANLNDFSTSPLVLFYFYENVCFVLWIWNQKFVKNEKDFSYSFVGFREFDERIRNTQLWPSILERNYAFMMWLVERI